MTCDGDIVISGMSGRFAESNNIAEFEYNLYNKIDMINDDITRFNHTNPKIPKKSGKVPNISKFDAVFFGVPEKQAHMMDPQQRILVEEAFKAVMDAGVSPQSIRGSNTGVYIASSFSETEKELYHTNQDLGKRLIGCRKAFFANRISYYLGLHGPSMLVDTACSSSLYGLDLAMKALQTGEIDSAIVGGSTLCLHPLITLQFALLGVLSADGTCRPFDVDANGYTRSEAVSCVFLQRRSVAKRVYATVLCSKTNSDGFKHEGITYPSSSVQEQLLKEIYCAADIDVNDLGYIEAHATSTIVGDPEECKAIDNAIGSQRSEPLLVGSIKSNCGHAEPAAGMCSLVKVLLTLQNGVIPPNINFTSARKSIEALVSGRLKVVYNPTKLPKPIVGINSFGFGGSNAHAVLKQHTKEKPSFEKESGEKYRLVTWSGRTEASVHKFLSYLELHPLNEEYLALTQSAQSGGIRGMVFRGYTILECVKSKENPKVLRKNVQHYGGWKNSVVWLFSGIGSQWIGTGKSLMQLSLFKQSIQRSHNTLKPTGLDVIKIVSATDASTSNNIIHSHVGIAAIQIAFVDLLRELGCSPDIIIGHSAGELICAYADGSLTAEQVMLAAYYLGKVSSELSNIKVSHVAVGLGFKNIKPILPNTIEVASHISVNSCTIIGPREEVEKFVIKLKANNVTVTDIQCSNMAYHNKCIAHLGPELLKYLKHIIPNPKLRSSKWISTSVPKDHWLQEENKYSSAEYFTNTFLNSVLFEEATSVIPKHAVTIDFASHDQLKIFSKRAVSEGLHIALNEHNTEDSTFSFLNAIGSLYNKGIELRLENLYDKISFPVSRGTPTISSLIDFDHSKDYFVYFSVENSAKNGKMGFSVKLADHYLYLKGHEIDGRVLAPATFYLECVWRTFASMKGILDINSFSVEFENVKFERATTLSNTSTSELSIVIQKGNGYFEVTESDSLIVCGAIKNIEDQVEPKPISVTKSRNCVSIIKKDFYKELKLRGYHYNGDFQAVEMSSSDGSHGKLKWTENWVTYMDCMLQLIIIGQDSRTLMLPTKLRKLRIFPEYHRKTIANNSIADVFSNAVQRRIVSGGIEIIGLDASAVQRRRVPGDPVLESYQFISHFPAPVLSVDDIARCCIQLALENQPKSKLQIVELESEHQSDEFLVKLSNAVGDLPLVTGNYTLIHKDNTNVDENIDLPDNFKQLSSDGDYGTISGFIVIVGEKIEANTTSSTIFTNMDPNGYLICRTNKNLKIDKFVIPDDFVPVAFFSSSIQTYVMLERKENATLKKKSKVLQITSSDIEFKWVEKLQMICKTSNNVIVVTQGETLSGILGLINCLRKEPDTKDLRCVFILDENAPTFDISLPLYANQLQLGLAVNVFKNGKWGTYRHLKHPEDYNSKAHSTHVYGNIKQVGDLSSLMWLDGPLPENNREVRIMYASLNFKDVMQASGRLPIATFGQSRLGQTCIFGFEYSGINMINGKHIMGMTHQGAVSSHIHDPPKLFWEVPKNWSLREAATVPVVYLTVYYAFFFTADIRRGKSILIHAGSGGIGLAAIRIAQAYGLEVFTTVSTPEKKAFLLKTFPKLNENYIGNSRDVSFEDMIMEKTQGDGVDFVLNSLSEDKLKASLRCLGRGGHFMEIGKFDMANDNELNLGLFQNEITFHAILADSLLDANDNLIEDIKQHMSDDIKKGIIQPIPSTVFPAHEIEKAFRYLMSGKHIGKVMLQIHENPDTASSLPLLVLPQIYFSSDLVYVVPGGIGGFGLELVDWMILRGARKIVLSSSRGISNDYQKLRINLWKNYGCEIVIDTSNIGTAQGCLELINNATNLAPVGGIFNLAVVLRDAIFPNQTTELFQQSFQPKAFATKYLDEISRKLCPKLQHFVIFSSVSCGRGNAGQTNYGMANSIMERIIEDRVAQGLPGKAIQWGAVGEVGLVAEMAAGKIDLEIGGTLQQRISSCIEVLDKLLSSPDPIVASMVVAEKKAQTAGQSPIEFVLNAMSIRDIKSVSMNSTLTELGMDSLMSVEIKQAFERDYDIVLSNADLRSLSFAKLMELSENAKVVKHDPINNDKDESTKSDSIAHLRQFYGQIKNLGDTNLILDHINNITNGDPIIILPGIDGCSGEVWHAIGKNLTKPAYVLQYHKTLGAKNITEVVDFVTKTICERLAKHNAKKFQIVAYSFGAMVGHYAVASLEENGYQGKTVLIDGSPQFIQNIIGSLQFVYEGIELDKMTIGLTLSILLPKLPYETIQADLQYMLFKEEWFKYIYVKLNEHKFENIDAMFSNIEAIYQRLKMIQSPDTYENIGIVNAELLLLKPKEDTIAKFDEFYGLSPFTRSHINIDVLEGNHQTILQNIRLPDVINDFFNSKN